MVEKGAVDSVDLDHIGRSIVADVCWWCVKLWKWYVMLLTKLVATLATDPKAIPLFQED
jgi:hypothetical protein